MAAEELLDQLWDVLAEVRVQPVHMLRPLALRHLGLRPGQVEIEARVDLLLGDAHGPEFDAGPAPPGPSRTLRGCARGALRARGRRRSGSSGPGTPDDRSATLLP